MIQAATDSQLIDLARHAGFELEYAAPPRASIITGHLARKTLEVSSEVSGILRAVVHTSLFHLFMCKAWHTSSEVGSNAI